MCRGCDEPGVVTFSHLTFFFHQDLAELNGYPPNYSLIRFCVATSFSNCHFHVPNLVGLEVFDHAKFSSVTLMFP